MQLLARLIGRTPVAEPAIATIPLRNVEQDASAGAVVDGQAHDPVSGRKFNVI
jgi:hypothetical protein